jgi:hypothetical protein
MTVKTMFGKNRADLIIIGNRVVSRRGDSRAEKNRRKTGKQKK